MGTNRAACPLRAPATIQAPYGRLIEQTALLIELTALAVGPFPPTLRGGGPLHRPNEGTVECCRGVFRKCVHSCWQTEAGNVNWGQPEVSFFTGPVSSSSNGVGWAGGGHLLSETEFL